MKNEESYLATEDNLIYLWMNIRKVTLRQRITVKSTVNNLSTRQVTFVFVNKKLGKFLGDGGQLYKFMDEK